MDMEKEIATLIKMKEIDVRIDGHRKVRHTFSQHEFTWYTDLLDNNPCRECRGRKGMKVFHIKSHELLV
jgi:hypothetical protein